MTAFIHSASSVVAEKTAPIVSVEGKGKGSQQNWRGGSWDAHQKKMGGCTAKTNIGKIGLAPK